MDEEQDDLIPTRTSLLVRLKDWQDEAGWRDFFDTYWTLIYGVALQSGLNHSEAQDVVQETLIAVAKQMPAFKYDRSLGSFKGWLLNMTRWRVADQIRRRTVNEARHALPDDTATGTRTIERIADPASGALAELWEREWEKNLLA